LKRFQRRDGSFIFSQYNGNIPDASDIAQAGRGLTSFAGSSREVSGELARFKLFMKASHIGKRFREKDCVTLRNLVSPRNGIPPGNREPGEVRARAAERDPPLIVTRASSLRVNGACAPGKFIHRPPSPRFQHKFFIHSRMQRHQSRAIKVAVVRAAPRQLRSFRGTFPEMTDSSDCESNVGLTWRSSGFFQEPAIP
jgi:hypothetical protein